MQTRAARNNVERDKGIASRAEASHSRSSIEQKATFKGHLLPRARVLPRRTTGSNRVAIFLKVTYSYLRTNYRLPEEIVQRACLAQVNARVVQLGTGIEKSTAWPSGTAKVCEHYAKRVPGGWRNMASTHEVQSSSVTVSVTRKIDPLRADEVTAWIQSGVNLASRWPGFLGSGWVRSSTRRDEWYVLYRFADPSSLSAWEGSSSRKGWLDQGDGLIEEGRVEKLTGIEGWFDSIPQPDSGRSVPPSRPVRWKQAVSVWLAFFPVSLIFALVIESLYPEWSGLWTAARVFVTTTILTPIMTVWVLPVVTRLLRSWLRSDAVSQAGQTTTRTIRK